jgi:hypothetical protein
LCTGRGACTTREREPATSAFERFRPAPRRRPPHPPVRGRDSCSPFRDRRFRKELSSAIFPSSPLVHALAERSALCLRRRVSLRRPSYGRPRLPNPPADSSHSIDGSKARSLLAVDLDLPNSCPPLLLVAVSRTWRASEARRGSGRAVAHFRSRSQTPRGRHGFEHLESATMSEVAAHRDDFAVASLEALDAVPKVWHAAASDEPPSCASRASTTTRKRACRHELSDADGPRDRAAEDLESATTREARRTATTSR